MSQQLRVLPFFLNLSLVHSIYNGPLKTPVTPASGHLMLSAGPSGAWAHMVYAHQSILLEIQQFTYLSTENMNIGLHFCLGLENSTKFRRGTSLWLFSEINWELSFELGTAVL